MLFFNFVSIPFLAIYDSSHSIAERVWFSKRSECTGQAAFPLPLSLEYCTTMLQPIPLDIPVATEALIERYAKDAHAVASFPASQTAIVVDFGSHTMRCGWAGESNPHVAVQSVVSRARPKYDTGSLRPVVGALGEDAVPSFDTSRGAYVFKGESGYLSIYL